MKKKWIIIISVAVVLALAFAITGAIGTGAWLSDQETSVGNEFTAGTIDLKVDDKDDPNVVNYQLGGLAPGWSNIYVWVLKNVGDQSGVVKIEITNLVELENNTNEPEGLAEISTFTPCGGPTQTVGITDSGELGYLMKAVPSKKHIFPSVEKSPGVPCGNSYMPNGGGLHYLSTIGPFELGRTTAEATLGPGETMEFWLRVSLADNIKSWDGCSNHDIDDNVIQDDSVTFDIVFNLEQVP